MRVAEDADAFVAAIQDAVTDGPNGKWSRPDMRSDSWGAKAQEILRSAQEAGIHFVTADGEQMIEHGLSAQLGQPVTKAALNGADGSQGIAAPEDRDNGYVSDTRTSNVLHGHIGGLSPKTKPPWKTTQRRTQKTVTPLAELRQHLKALILLGGTMRASHFSKTIGRSILDLPVSADQSILALWMKRSADLASAFELDTLTVRVIIDRRSRIPTPPVMDERIILNIDYDPNELRGTGGVLRDLATGYDHENLLLVGTAAQVCAVPLMDLVWYMASKQADVAIVTSEDGMPSGLMLIRCGVLNLIPAVGFVDFKEQALPIIAAHHHVAILRREEPVGLGIRNAGGYLSSLRQYHAHWSSATDAFREDWEPMFSIVETGAEVDPSARVYDSVVLAGGRVEPNAVIARSLVCPGGVVPGDTKTMTQMVGPTALS